MSEHRVRLYSRGSVQSITAAPGEPADFDGWTWEWAPDGRRWTDDGHRLPGDLIVRDPDGSRWEWSAETSGDGTAGWFVMEGTLQR